MNPFVSPLDSTKTSDGQTRVI